MKNLYYLKTLAVFFSVVLFSSLNAQKQDSFWQVNENFKNNSQTASPVIFYKNRPKTSSIIDFDLDALKTQLQNVPQRVNSSKNDGIVITFPDQNAKPQRFLVQEASVFAPDLQAQFPDIRSFVGKGIDNKTALIRFSLSPQKGLSVMILSSEKTVFIEPYTQNLETYISFINSDEDLPYSDFVCEFEDNQSSLQFGQNRMAQPKNANDQTLRTYRLALACTGEYAQFHGGTVASVNAAYNTTMTRVNGIYEREMAITMVLVPNNNNVIFLDGTTDPYNNNNGFVMLDENQITCDTNIGSTNYDIGHVFSTGGGGIAQLNSPCTASGKAKGVTGLSNPTGDSFDVDYVCHEMGHQYGATHTQNNNCNRTLISAIEPGSASTIMGYAGICAPNVQNNSDDYFSTASINQMWNNVSVGNSTCFVGSTTGNQAPVANAGANVSIPPSTAFVLRGTANDADTANGLTYCWEQTDNTPATMPPSSASIDGPLFRSIVPSTSSNRYMPPLSVVMGGNLSTTWEVVPSVARTINFNLTVRDNELNGAATDTDAKVITVENVTPFTVNTPSNWGQGNTETVTWVVGNTNVAPINCQNVNILFTTDSGVSFTTLATNIPNNGSATITVPSIADTNNAQILVEAADNIFYAVSTTFDVANTFSVNENQFTNLAIYPNPNQGTFYISLDTLLDEKVNIEVYDIRGRKIYNQAIENTMKFEKTVNLNNPSSGVYLVKVRQAANQVTKRVIIE